MDELLERLEGVPDIQKYGAVAGLIALCCGLFFWLSYSPGVEEIERMDKKIAELNAEIKRGEEIRSRERELEEEIRRLNANLEEALEFLPKQKEMNTFIKTIESLAVESGLKVDRFLPRPPVVDGFQQKQPVELGVRGNFRSMGLFFEKLGFETRIVTVRSLRINAQTGPGITLNATIMVEAFYFKDEV